jgi:hypothetical protein
MTPSEFILKYRTTVDEKQLSEYRQMFAFNKMQLPEGYYGDSNFGFRTEIVNELLHDFSLSDIDLIRALFAEEMNCELSTQLHDNLYQLCFYLYDLGQLEDTFILYDAKYNAKNSDVGMSLDREAITVGHDPDDVIAYVEAEFTKRPELKEKFSGIVKELESIKTKPDYDDLAEYGEFLKGYFGVGEVESETKTDQNISKSAGNGPTAIPKKPWWMFWG